MSTMAFLGDDAINAPGTLLCYCTFVNIILQIEWLAEMAQLNLAIDHGQTSETARDNFERTIVAARSRYGTWIHRLDWSEDRTKATLAGPGYEVELSFDDQKVYARGSVPWAFKLFEGPVKAFIKESLGSQP